jgi:hypothetical protein
MIIEQKAKTHNVEFALALRKARIS